MTLQAIFVGRTSRSEMIGLFLAMLELVRLKKIHVLQDDAEAPIRLELRSGLDQSVIEGPPRHDWRDPETGEVQYEWPSEAARLRAERRAQRTHGRPFAERDEPAIELDNAEPKPA